MHQPGLPIVQNTSPWSVSSSAINCIIATRALNVNTNAIPSRIMPELAILSQRDMLSSNNDDRRANINAFAGTNHAADIPGIPIPNTIARAAPNAAAEETPSVKGLANGLLRIVCISAPQVLASCQPIKPLRRRVIVFPRQ